MKVSIFENKIVHWVDYSNREDCIEVKEIDEKEFIENIENQKKEVSEVSEITAEEKEEQEEEAKIQNIEKLMVRKQAFKLLWKDVKVIDEEIQKIIQK